MALFSDRYDAGQKLARDLIEYRGRADVIVLALPRGGVPVGFEVARFLGAPLDILLVRKLGVPGQAELAMGAIASRGVRVINKDVIRQLHISTQVIDQAAAVEQQELERREATYRGSREYPNLEEKIVILVDDGLATGASMHAAVDAVRQQYPAKIIVAVPIAAAQTCAELSALVDQMVCNNMPQPFRGVGKWYADFSQISDDAVRELLDQANALTQTSRPNNLQGYRGE